MKKIACLSILALSFTALAHQNTGFYVAADAGIISADFNNSYIDQTDAIAQNFQQDITQHGYTGGIALGYTHPIRHRFFIGGEVSGNMDSSSAVFQEGASSAAFSDTTQLNEHMDFSLINGMKLTRTISTFLKLGVSLAWIQNNLTSPAGFTPITTYYTNHNTQTGFIAGLGVSKALRKHISLFTEADYRDYGSASFQNFQNFSATYSHSTRLYTYDVVGGLAYQF